MDNDDFTGFLKLLSSSSGGLEEPGQCYVRLHKKLVGFFSMRGISDPAACADATIDIAVAKVAAGTPVPDPLKYCKGIARNLVKEKLRHERREASVFLSFIEDISDGSDAQTARIYQILKPCFERLTADEQNLLVGYCRVLRGRARAEHRRSLAESMNTSVLALRMRVTRLRTVLADCMKELSDAN